MAEPISKVIRSWILRVALVAMVGGLLACPWVFFEDLWLSIFCTIFTLRYARFLGHFVGYWAYRPSKVSDDPKFGRHDVTVILPTIDPNGPDFQECIRSILANRVAEIIVITVGAELRAECQRVLEALTPEAGSTSLVLSSVPKPSKRRQIAHAMPHVHNPITILADDHVFWPSQEFVPSVLAPFENDRVGMVATKKRVRRTTPGKWSWTSIVNFVACNYLERHNWELRASNAIDGGVFVISGRTAVYRTEFLADNNLLEEFCNEKFFFGLFGGDQGLGPDDDNFLTRNAMKNGWLIRFQDTEDATIETTLGEWPKFKGQLLRWARTTFRSNPVMLRDPIFLYRYMWSAFMVYWPGITNFALLWDAALIFTFVKARQSLGIHWALVGLLVLWILATKVVKIVPQLLRHPSDITLFIFQVLFAYTHSLLKLWAMVTFWDCDWSGRRLDEVAVDSQTVADSFDQIN